MAAAVDVFARAVQANFATHIPGQPEDQLKAPIQTLLSSLGVHAGLQVTSRTESRVAGLGGRPDIGVAVGGLLVGHVELKAPGRGARPELFTGADRVQWLKFQSLPNLVYTDGGTWSLFRTGQLVARVRLFNDLVGTGPASLIASAIPEFEVLSRAFFGWRPQVPTNPEALAAVLAPLCRILRTDVEALAADPTSAIAQLARDWRAYLFPEADDAQFADAYAQTLTYSLLLARISGAPTADPIAAAAVLDTGHSLLAQVLRLLADAQAREELALGVDLLERAIGAIDVARLGQNSAEPWLYFYEQFLEAYDPRLRRDRGVYYTPIEVVHAQVRLVDVLLISRLGKPLSYADEEVVVLDPAVGTGTYPLAALQHGVAVVSNQLGAGAVADAATRMARNMFAFEILVGPYAVAHLRLTQQILDANGLLPRQGVHVFLADTLESPFVQPMGQMTLMHRKLSEEHARAQEVKANTRVLVCIGNPPYDRQQREDPSETIRGGWVRFGDHGDDGILEAFTEPAQAAGAGRHLKNIYNDYIYFWRWALWKVLETTEESGIISFITASSYLRGPGFVGVRKVMREEFDELWILDLEGGALGPRKTENVFNIATPVAIAIGVRYGAPDRTIPADVHYAVVEGSREQKLATLDAIEAFSDVQWRDCQSDWLAPFLPAGTGDFFSWPLLSDVFPWQQAGVKVGRTWPIAPTREVLSERWNALCGSGMDERRALFKDSPTGRKFDWAALNGTLPRIRDLTTEDEPLEYARYGFRPFDRQWLINDPRVLDRASPSLWRAHSPDQVYLVSLTSEVLGAGPAALVSALVPDLHSFRGSYGGKDVFPLFRDSAPQSANIGAGLLDRLEQILGARPSPADVIAYVYAVLANPSYGDFYSEELTLSTPRVPFSEDPALFRQMVDLGRRLLWLHTYGERFWEGQPPLEGRARCTVAVPGSSTGYPERFRYDAITETLHVGTGQFHPVSNAVADHSVSGYPVLAGWLADRMRLGSGRTSSSLDEIRSEQWTLGLTHELLELIWLLEETTEMRSALDDIFLAVIGGPIVHASDLPAIPDAERQADRPDPVADGHQRALGLE